MTTLHTSARFIATRLLAVTVAFAATLALAQQPAPPSSDGPDPALANMAPADAAAIPQQAPAPIVRQSPGQPDDSYNAPPPATTVPLVAPTDDSASPQAVADEAAGVAAINDANLSTDQVPPPLPSYDQPPAPDDGYAWTPGYWGYFPTGYYWVPGVWIRPPYYGALWTPPYWGWYGGRYHWHPGYWGLHIGFYGGIDYGFGYIGTGYWGGYWRGNAFFYNRAVTNVGVSVTNVYSHTVVYNNHVYGPGIANRVSYNGGRGGVQLAPRPAELAAMHESHIPPLAGQARLHANAANNPQAAFSANHGNPALAAQPRPLGATRTVSASQAAFQHRPDYQQQMHPNLQPNPQSQQPMTQPGAQSQQPRSQSHPQSPSRQPPASRPAAHPAQSHPAPHVNSGKH